MESLGLREERSPLELATPMESLGPREDNRNVLLPMEEVDAQVATKLNDGEELPSHADRVGTDSDDHAIAGRGTLHDGRQCCH